MSNPCYSAGSGPINPRALPPQDIMVAALVPAARITSGGAVVGGVDRAGYGHATLLVQSGATSGSPSSFTVTVRLQHASSLNGSYTDIPGAPTAVVSVINSSATVVVSLAGAKQFVRLVQVPNLVGGTAPTILCSSAFYLGA